MRYPDQPLEGADYFGTYVPSAAEARRYYELTGRRVVALASAIDEEFGTGGDPFVVTRLSLELGGVDKIIDAGPNIPPSFL
jgi:hypothetical protein